jgi:DNA polymerase III subunit beta
VKISISKDKLLAQLGIAVRAASSRSAVQTLAGVLVEAKGTSVELRATDMEIGIRVPLDARVEREGTVVLPARLLVEVVRSLPKEELVLEQHAGQEDVQLSSGAADFRLRTLPRDDFPRLPEPPADPSVRLAARAFIDTAERVARSASRDETRPHLTGVLISATGSDLRMVATDSYRLSVKETSLERAVDRELEVNVPARALQELTRIATVEGDVEVWSLDGQVIFRVGEVTVSSRLVEGRFPNYRQLLPDAYEHELRLHRAELLEVVRRIGLMAQKNAPLRLAFSDGELEVSAQTPDVGRASESLPVPFKGEPLEIGFNPEFLRDGLESVEAEELVVKLISPLRPGLIESGDDGGFTYLVMPIRLNV